MYCGHKFEARELTLDHVFPKSRGGKGTWENLVAACRDDNHRKGNLTLEEAGMKLIHRPLPATLSTSRWLLKQLGNQINPAWGQYLWNDSKGETRLQFN